MADASAFQYDSSMLRVESSRTCRPLCDEEAVGVVVGRLTGGGWFGVIGLV